MAVVRRVKLLRLGRDQIVRIPREFELAGEEAVIRRNGERLVIESASRRSLLSILAALPAIDEDFPRIEDPSAEPFDF